MVYRLFQDSEVSRIFAHYKSDFMTVQRLHEAHENPRDILRELTQITDTLIIRILTEYLHQMLHRNELPYHILLLAQGGYGRRELHPRSDVDILFLHTQPLSNQESEMVKKVFQVLFDLGFVLGHCCRSYKGALEFASTDPQSQTAMSESRLLMGDWRLFETFKNDLWRILSRNKADRIRQKIHERVERRALHGTTINISEPNIKESPGGLRDYHFGLWIGSLYFNRSLNLIHLKRSHLIDDLMMNQVEKALEFHWRLRNDLHFFTHREQDVLALPLQHEISLRLGYKDRRERFAEEEMMREYYANALVLCNFADHISRRCSPKSLWSKWKFKIRRHLSDGFEIINDELHIPQDIYYFEHNPQRLIMAFIHSAEQRVGFARETAEAVHDNLDLVDQLFLHDRRNAELLRHLFAIPRNIEPVVQEMRSVGLLQRLFPEWRGIDHLVRYDLIHRFTVDEHSLLCLYHLEHLQNDQFSYSSERHSLWLECQDKDILRLAVLFHDIGKGRNGDHSLVGARLVDDIARRMRLPDEKRELLVFLVENHLLLSHAAQHRDISDPQVTADFSDAIRNLNTLTMLYLLTYVDMRSVSPESMTEWKNNLLWQFYLATRDNFIGERAELTSDTAPPREFLRKEKIFHTLSREFEPEMVQTHLDSLPPSYLLYQSIDQIRKHLAAVEVFDRRKPVTQFYLHIDSDCLDMVLVWYDQVGLFNKICTAVMLENFTIMEARLNTRSDSLVVNNIVICDALGNNKAISTERQMLLQDRLERILLSTDPPPKLPRTPVTHELGRTRFTKQVKILNEITPRFTVIEVRCADRRGLLQNITSVLYNMDLSIHFARIITNASQVTDIFYVAEPQGGKITDESKLEQLKQQIQMVIEPVLHHV